MPQTEAVNRVIEVVGAVILLEGRVLCVQRGPDGSLPGMWEFPGGKIEAGESPQEALEREIEEELRCRVSVGDEVNFIAHQYDFGDVHLRTFYCELAAGTPQLVEHSQLVWSDPRDLRVLDWAPADLPAVTAIEQRFNNYD